MAKSAIKFEELRKKHPECIYWGAGYLAEKLGFSVGIANNLLSNFKRPRTPIHYDLDEPFDKHKHAHYQTNGRKGVKTGKGIYLGHGVALVKKITAEEITTLLLDDNVVKRIVVTSSTKRFVEKLLIALEIHKQNLHLLKYFNKVSTHHNDIFILSNQSNHFASYSRSNVLYLEELCHGNTN